MKRITDCLRKRLNLAFSLVELMVSLIVISLITAAMAPVITKKLSSGAITIGSFGGTGAGSGATCPPQYFFNDSSECEICPVGHFCDGTNKMPCMAGSAALKGQTMCKECPDGQYALEKSEMCQENTAEGCDEKSKTENACISCANESDVIVEGNCVGYFPSYTYKDTSGYDVTSEATEAYEDDTYWYIKIKQSGFLTFNTSATNLMDVFLVGGGAGGMTSYSDWCGSGVVGGGGNHVFERNVYIKTQQDYKITIGGGGGSHNCASTNSVGGTTGAFGLYARGGIYQNSKTVCEFGNSSCTTTYGNKGTSSNQQANTGNGGNVGKAGMSGVVIVRGKKTNPNYIKAGLIPVYTHANTEGADNTTNGSTLYVSDSYWYIKLTKSGKISFNYLPSNFIDVFAVGGGAGGLTSYSDWCGSGTVGGGANVNTNKNVYVNISQSYPITIGSGGGSHNCASTNSVGGTTSGFGVFTRGGIYKSSHTTCPFNESTCSTKYGNAGSSANQNFNTGNGGLYEYGGMDGVIILRGKLNTSLSSANIPSYSFLNASGVDNKQGGTTLTITDDYWYINIAETGYISFDYLPSSFVDIFLVGGGAGGLTSYSDWCGSGTVGGGANSGSYFDNYLYTGRTYPVTIGSGGGSHNCASNNTVGGTTKGFGLSSGGGYHKANLSVCAFNEPSCAFKYGNAGSNTDQNFNTGNGGLYEYGGMNGTIIIRGKRKPLDSVQVNKLPVYSYKDSAGTDISIGNTALSTTSTHWYLKISGSGNLSFEQLASNKIDIFLVGGGAGGLTSYSDWCGSGTVGGGGSFKVQLNVDVNTGESYPIVVGKGGGSHSCASTNSAGGATSATFGETTYTAAGGTGQTARTVCLFNETDCSYTFGNAGANSNQNANTGNGGALNYGGMSGVVIIRGKL